MHSVSAAKAPATHRRTASHRSAFASSSFTCALWRGRANQWSGDRQEHHALSCLRMVMGGKSRGSRDLSRGTGELSSCTNLASRNGRLLRSQSAASSVRTRQQSCRKRGNETNCGIEHAQTHGALGGTAISIIGWRSCEVCATGCSQPTAGVWLLTTKSSPCRSKFANFGAKRKSCAGVTCSQQGRSGIHAAATCGAVQHRSCPLSLLGV